MITQHQPKRARAVLQSVGIVLGLLSLAIPIRVISAKVGEISQDRADTAVTEAAPLPAEWKETVVQLKAFVEGARGLEFKHDVPVILESPQDFGERLEAESEGDMPTAGESYVALKALNLVDRSLDLSAAEDPLQDGGTMGYYDAFSNRLVVQGTQPTPYTRMILVHELTHALQDQHFNLNQELDSYDEAFWGFDALVEGDATRVENLYLATLTPEDRAKVDEEAMGELPPASEAPAAEAPDAPLSPKERSLEVLSMLSGFSYEVGEDFASEVFTAGGQARLDRAFLSPPTTTEQILHPERFLERQRPSAVSPPRSQGTVYEEGVWGERGLLTMLLNTLPEDQAWEAADGWAGDSYVAYKKSGDECIRINMVTDSKADKDQLVRALRTWSLQQPAASVKSGKTIEIQSCTAGIAKGSRSGSSES